MIKSRSRYRSSFTDEDICLVNGCDESLKKSNLRTDRRLCAKHRRLASIYSLMDQELVALFSKNDGKCHVCKTSKATHIDHDHTCCPYTKDFKSSCGACVRGALCFSCKRGIDALRAEPDLLKSGIEYLRDGRIRMESDLRYKIKNFEQQDEKTNKRGSSKNNRVED